MILAGRCVAGFCVGIASLALPVYLGETVQPEVRGTLGLLPTFLGNIGEYYLHDEWVDKFSNEENNKEPIVLKSEIKTNMYIYLFIPKKAFTNIYLSYDTTEL